MLIAGASIASVVTLTRNDIAYMLVIIWAFVGIAVKHGDSPAVATAAWVVTALAVLVLVVGIVLGRRQKQQLTTTLDESALRTLQPRERRQVRHVARRHR